MNSSRFPKETEKYLRERIVPILTPIDDTISELAIAQILFLNMEDTRKPIHLFVNSPGGYVASCIAIYDTITRGEGAPIYTYGLRQASGMAALLVAAGAKDQRMCLPDCRFMLVPCSGGSAADANDIPKIQSRVEDEFARLTGHPWKELHDDMTDERQFDAKGAVAYGLVDRIVTGIPGPKGE